MDRSIFPISLIAAALLLAGCSTARNQVSPERIATPTSTTRHGANPIDAYYALGRYYQGQLRYDQAIAAYQEVLEAQPKHADAHNALGVIYALQGRQALAESELRAALGLMPGAAHIHNNLGYALLMQGRVTEALPAFEEAVRLDPDYARASENLQLARIQRETRMANQQPSPLPAPEIMARAPALPSSSSLEEKAASDRSMALGSGNVYELQLPAPHLETSRPPVPVQALGFSIPRLEVANGNGIEGLARRTSDYLKGAGYQPARLTNQKPYEQVVTEIQVRPGYEREAQKLQMSLAGKGVITQGRSLRQDLHLRLVLGKDMKSPPLLAASEGEAFEPATLASSE